MHVRVELRSTMLSLSLNVPIVGLVVVLTTSATARLPRLDEDWGVYVNTCCVRR